MNTQGPYTVTLDAAAHYSDPNATSNNPSAALQVQNSSTFVLTVLANGENYTLQPFTAQTVPLGAGGGAPITITPTQNPSGAAVNTITLVWLFKGEDPPMADGPLTSAALIAAISGALDVGFFQESLLNQGAWTYTNASNFQFSPSGGNSIAIPKGILSIAVQLAGVQNFPTVGNDSPYGIEASCSGSGATLTSQDQAVANPLSGAAGGSWAYLDVLPESTAQLFLSFPTGGAPTPNGDITIIGYSAPAAMVRPKDRYIGSFTGASKSVAANGSAALLPAPGATNLWAYEVKTITLLQGAAAGTLYVAAASSGALILAGNGGGAPPALAVDLLLFEGLTLVSLTTPGSGYCTYRYRLNTT